MVSFLVVGARGVEEFPVQVVEVVLQWGVGSGVWDLNESLSPLLAWALSSMYCTGYLLFASASSEGDSIYCVAVFCFVYNVRRVSYSIYLVSE